LESLCLLLAGIDPSFIRFIHRTAVRHSRGWEHWKRLSILCTVGFLLATSSLALQAVKDVKRVLLINDFNPLSSPGVGILDQGIVGLLESSPYQIELYSENLEATLFSDDSQVREAILRKYSSRKPDVLISIGPASLQFLIESHQQYFPNIPVVFCGSTMEMVNRSKVDSAFTGVWGTAQPEETLKSALHLEPNTKHVVVVGGVGEIERKGEAITRQSLRKYESRLDFTYLTNLDMPTLLERLRHLPSDTIVYYTGITRDGAGNRFINAAQSVPLVAGASNAPVFAMDDVEVRGGVVGGDVTSYTAEGKSAGELAVRILNGERPEKIPITQSPNVYMFDWSALKRWGLEERNLPSGSIVLNRQPSVWESYRWYIVGGLSAITLESALIVALLWQRAWRRRAENELSREHDRLRMAVEAGRSVGWDTDLRSGRNRWFGDLQSMFGIEGDNYNGRMSEFRSRVHPEDRGTLETAIAEAREKRGPYSVELRIVRPDGDERWISARGKFYCAPNGDPERMLGMAADITERKLAEEALNSLSGRLIQAQDEERSRIARELHDDFQQRLAMLSIDLEDLANYVEGNSEASDRLHELWNRVGELGSDLHVLSHGLHSTTLDNLGLVAALEALCAEFRDYHSIDVNFAEENVPPNIPNEVALCLFRITQEALQNVKKHSSAESANVRVEGLEHEIHLSVFDTGSGFDSSAASLREGIGIKSMEERVRLVEGHFAIHSRLGEGTKVEVWAPIGSPLLAQSSRLKEGAT
jgi:PAS domain S-box-containing protein